MVFIKYNQRKSFIFYYLNKHKKVFDKFIFAVVSETNDIYDIMLKYYISNRY